MNIAEINIGLAHKPFVIAEMSGNHDGSLDKALAIVEAAAKSGADALKLQTYTADTMTLNLTTDLFTISDPTSLWNGRTLFDLYQEAHTPWEWHRPIFERCRELGLLAFSTPFDSTAVDFLESLNNPMYKIASFENTDHALLRRVAGTGKPIIMSTGLATLGELEESVEVLRTAGCQDLVLLKCTSAYPAPPTAIDLRAIKTMRERLNVLTGLSDHTLGTAVSVAAIATGAVLIEKHFTIDRTAGGVDAAFSMEPSEMAALARDCRIAWQALGSASLGRHQEEQGSMMFRRSLFISQPVSAGDCLSVDNVRAIRPGYGLPPKHLDSVLGKSVCQDLPAGTPLSWEILDMDSREDEGAKAGQFRT